MTTIINSPKESNSDTGVALGLIVGVVIAAIGFLLFFIYGIPGMTKTNPDEAQPDKTTIDIQLPAAAPADTAEPTE